MSKNIFVLLCIFALTAPCVMAEDDNSFFSIFEKLAAQKGVSVPDTIERKAFEFVTIVKPAQSVTFKMGSDKGADDEKPVHEVSLKRAFQMQRTEVTQFQYFIVMMKNPSYFRENNMNRPVERVSFEDVNKFIAKLNELDTKYRYMLPTEAQWEYAARGGTSTEYYFSNEPTRLGEYAWFEENSKEQTQEVAMKKPNLYGLYDMTGNVWEWVSDYYGEKYYSSSPGTDPQGPSSGEDRVLRGASWNFNADNCRIANRFHSPSTKFYSYGFRLIRETK